MSDLIPAAPPRPLVTALHGAWAASRVRATRHFEAASCDPARTQGLWLARFLRENAETAYGRAHHFASVSSPEDFRRRVPIAAWDTLAPWVERIAQGEAQVLTREPVLLLERTSGSAAGPKHIPYTRGLLADFSAATGPWLSDVFRAFPALFTLRQYWSVSPAGRPTEVTPGGLRIGLEDDTEYFDSATRWALRRLMALDGRAARLGDMAEWRDTTLTALLRCEDLGFVSIWNPSFLTLLMEQLAERWTDLSASLPARRVAAVQRRFDEAGAFTGEALWPHLKLISCWTDAWASQALPALRRFFPRTPFQGKGLLATEGVVTFPLWGQPAPVAAVTSHFLEFESLDDPGEVRGVEGLEPQARYAPLLTTRGGFARYRLPDVVRCVGHWRALPLLRFEGRLDRTGDLRGEKLHAARAEAAVRTACAGHTVRFVLLAPTVREPVGYVLYLDSPEPDEVAARIAHRVEQQLLDDLHYRYCRDLGQLTAVRVCRVPHAEGAWLEALRARGQRLGDIKPSGFDPRPEWDEVFQRGRLTGDLSIGRSRPGWE